MGFKETLGKLVGLEEQEDTITEEEIEKEKEKLRQAAAPARPQATAAPQTQKPATTVIGRDQAARTNTAFTGTAAFKLVVIEPKSFDECPKLVDSLKGRRPVIINLENVETETAKKIFDFLSGAIYALNGGVQKVSNNIFIFAPESVDIASTQEDGRNFEFGQIKGSANWVK
ncbi:MAG: cell division protein SepF [Firmicutes bacterium]|nr:cell division protein SepF [Bacillota bacterium]MBQ7703217.1 cell division protein SepF [Bacillota bacterium]